MGFISTFISWASKTLAVASWTAWLGPLAPIVAGAAQFIGGIFQAVIEIVVAMSKSAEGRVMLAFIAAGLGFLYLRFHYIEEGKAMARVAAIAVRRACPSSVPERRRR
jgi:hypothetical protein